MVTAKNKSNEKKVRWLCYSQCDSHVLQPCWHVTATPICIVGGNRGQVTFISIYFAEGAVRQGGGGIMLKPDATRVK